MHRQEWWCSHWIPWKEIDLPQKHRRREQHEREGRQLGWMLGSGHS
jgi:hypothetical protein